MVKCPPKSDTLKYLLRMDMISTTVGLEFGICPFIGEAIAQEVPALVLKQKL